jgi:DNA-directed RNA polymerase
LVINNLLLNNIHEIQSIKKVKLDDTILKFANWFSSLVFYVPYILDWRGRIYPAVLYSHHHSRFARLFIHFGPSIHNAGCNLTQPLNDQGFRALKLYAAQIYGVQLSIMEKIDWFDSCLKLIEGMDPKFIKKADKVLDFYNLC